MHVGDAWRRTVGVVRVEEGVDIGGLALDAHLEHVDAELGLGDGAVLVLVPLVSSRARTNGQSLETQADAWR